MIFESSGLRAVAMVLRAFDQLRRKANLTACVRIVCSREVRDDAGAGISSVSNAVDGNRFAAGTGGLRSGKTTAEDGSLSLPVTSAARVGADGYAPATAMATSTAIAAGVLQRGRTIWQAL